MLPGSEKGSTSSFVSLDGYFKLQTHVQSFSYNASREQFERFKNLKFDVSLASNLYE
jgi:hypothetical protein